MSHCELFICWNIAWNWIAPSVTASVLIWLYCVLVSFSLLSQDFLNSVFERWYNIRGIMIISMSGQNDHNQWRVGRMNQCEKGCNSNFFSYFFVFWTRAKSIKSLMFFIFFLFQIFLFSVDLVICFCFFLLKFIFNKKSYSFKLYFQQHIRINYMRNQIYSISHSILMWDHFTPHHEAKWSFDTGSV